MTRTPSEFTGYYLLGSQRIDFVSTTTPDLLTVADIFVEDVRLTVYVDPNRGIAGVVGFDISASEFRPGYHELLVGLAEELADLIPYDDAGPYFENLPPHETIVRNFSSYFAGAPPSLPIQNLEIDIGTLSWGPPPSATGAPMVAAVNSPGPLVAPTSLTVQTGSHGSAQATSSSSQAPWDDDPLICDHTTSCNCDGDNEFSQLWTCCVTLGGPRDMPWDHDTRSLQYCRLTTLENLCGGSLEWGCRGRCGWGCKTPRKYMQDCLDHDWCVKYHDGSVAALTGNCGDEFYDSFDDAVGVYGLGHSRIRDRLFDALGYYENVICTW